MILFVDIYTPFDLPFAETPARVSALFGIAFVRLRGRWGLQVQRLHRLHGRFLLLAGPLAKTGATCETTAAWTPACPPRAFARPARPTVFFKEFL